jgi:hypothetical protein
MVNISQAGQTVTEKHPAVFHAAVSVYTFI